ncbi:tyrosine-type recombinase/integrase [Arthrobacter sp. ISL-65]|uniref:tyrosine-type recombinase/integrase n=1 Tax=Arthrobacter sp. ISL-65 TaxID=2819112 RepID=UPI001BED3A40|nr:tyrosine-type recombinase/integrase [Arthrobacter sp. ISL-65]MBT2550850.1 tyrosine-type recombinase/integrase [Arthrobacter sp. ISL-65]
MARVQRVLLDGAETTWTVLGDDFLPIPDIELYLEHLRQTGHSPNTVKSYSRSLQLWWEFLVLLRRPWEQIQIEDLSAFLAWIRIGVPPGITVLHPTPATSRIANSTASLRIQAVRSFYVFHQWRGHDFGTILYSDRPAQSSYEPFLGHTRRRRHRGASVSVPRRRLSAPTLTVRQIDAIKNHCGRYDPEVGSWSGSVRDRLLFTLLEETGLRLGEALSLQHRDWHAGRGESPYIDVEPRENHPHGLRVKGSRYRKIHISDGLDRLYAEYVWQLCEAGMDLAVPSMDDAYVFVNLRRGHEFTPMRAETVYKRVARIRKALGPEVPPKWTPHWFRHTHATAMLLAGAPLHVVSRRLGHADVQTTLDIYAWVSEDEELRSLADWQKLTERWRIDDEIG